MTRPTQMPTERDEDMCYNQCVPLSKQKSLADGYHTEGIVSRQRTWILLTGYAQSKPPNNLDGLLNNMWCSETHSGTTRFERLQTVSCEQSKLSHVSLRVNRSTENKHHAATQSGTCLHPILFYHRHGVDGQPKEALNSHPTETKRSMVELYSFQDRRHRVIPLHSKV